MHLIWLMRDWIWVLPGSIDRVTRGICRLIIDPLAIAFGVIGPQRVTTSLVIVPVSPRARSHYRWRSYLRAG